MTEIKRKSIQIEMFKEIEKAMISLAVKQSQLIKMF